MNKTSNKAKNKIKKIIILMIAINLFIATSIFASNVINIEKSSPINGEIAPSLNADEQVFADELNKIINETPSVIEIKNLIDSSNDIPIITFGSYMQRSNLKKDPIQWYILEKRGDRAILLSKYVLDTQKYFTKDFTITWDGSYIRKWLNDKFMKEAFTATEKKFITTNPYKSVGLISIPSYTDIENYFKKNNTFIDYVNATARIINRFKKDDEAPFEYWLYNNEASNTAEVIINRHGEKEEKIVTDVYGVRPMIILRFTPDNNKINNKIINQITGQEVSLTNNDMSAPIYVKDTVNDSFIYSFYDDHDTKLASQVKIRVPVIGSSNQAKADLMNNMLLATGIEAVRNSTKLHIDNYFEKTINVTFGDIKEQDYNTYMIPFTYNGMYICNLWFNLLTGQCYSE